mmetsp:Transcript_8085/g.12367  ORF Transcript_8085/g.12367 Transcript_8085/m.12367 type:complete len:127 (+) Transcript_8085:98-478(+)
MVCAIKVSLSIKLIVYYCYNAALRRQQLFPIPTVLMNQLVHPKEFACNSFQIFSYPLKNVRCPLHDSFSIFLSFLMYSRSTNSFSFSPTPATVMDRSLVPTQSPALTGFLPAPPSVTFTPLSLMKC